MFLFLGYGIMRKRGAEQRQRLDLEQIHSRDGSHVYTVVHETNRKDWLDLDWEMFENELPSPEQSPANHRNYKRGDELDTRPRKYHRSGLLQTVDHQDTRCENENIANEVNSPELAPGMYRSTKVLRPKDGETKHANKAGGNAKIK